MNNQVFNRHSCDIDSKEHLLILCLLFTSAEILLHISKDKYIRHMLFGHTVEVCGGWEGDGAVLIAKSVIISISGPTRILHYIILRTNHRSLLFFAIMIHMWPISLKFTHNVFTLYMYIYQGCVGHMKTLGEAGFRCCNKDRCNANVNPVTGRTTPAITTPATTETSPSPTKTASLPPSKSNCSNFSIIFEEAYEIISIESMKQMLKKKFSN